MYQIKRRKNGSMRLIREVFLNFKRSGFMSLISIGTIVITITMLGGYYIIQSGVTYFADSIRNRVEVVVFIKDGVSKQDVDALNGEASGLKDVREVKFVSKDDAYQEFAKDEEIGKILRTFDGNPLPDSLVLRFKEYSQASIREAVKYLEAKPAVQEVQYGAGDLENLLNVINAIKLIAGAAGIIFVIASIMVVSNIIKLTIYNRRQDIYVFKMVGATGSYIRLPFIFEGIIHGFAGGFLGWMILCGVINILIVEIKKDTGIDLSTYYMFQPAYFYFRFLIGSLAAGTALGLTGSLMSQGRLFR
jgi:cell division transport system permease protein